MEGISVEHLARELPVRGLDVLDGRGALHAQRRVVVGRRPHHQAPTAPPPRAVPRSGAGEWEADAAAPTGGSEVDPMGRESGGGSAGGGRRVGGRERGGERERH